MKRLLFIAVLAALAACGTAPAAGHSANVTPSCEGLGVAWSDWGDGNQYMITVTIDGITATLAGLDSSGNRFYSWSPTESHTWSVSSDNPDAPINQSDTQQPCTTTEVPPSTSSPPTSQPATTSTSTPPTSTETPSTSTPTTVVPPSSSSVPPSTTNSIPLSSTTTTTTVSTSPPTTTTSPTPSTPTPTSPTTTTSTVSPPTSTVAVSTTSPDLPVTK